MPGNKGLLVGIVCPIIIRSDTVAIRIAEVEFRVHQCAGHTQRMDLAP